jgi:hypothetical protein
MAVLTLSDVQIYNQALNRLGIVTGLATAVDGTDTSKFGKLAYPLYKFTRDEELRGEDWAKIRKRVELTQAQITDTGCSWTSGSDVVVCTDTTNIKVGWVLGSQIIQGQPPATPPVGIPDGTTVASITDGTHLVNETGYWFAYELPDDALRLTDVYAVYPASAYLYPFQIRQTLSYPFINEGGYIYTDLFTTTGTAIAEYIYEPADGTPPFAADFIEALILHLAAKLALPATQDKQKAAMMVQLYSAQVQKALGTSKMESAQAHIGEAWWRS